MAKKKDGNILTEAPMIGADENPTSTTTIKVVTEGTMKPKVKGGNLFVTIEGDGPEELSGYEAKMIAYNARFDYGFGNSGIDLFSGPFPVNASGEIDITPNTSNKPRKYRSIYKFHPSF